MTARVTMDLDGEGRGHVYLDGVDISSAINGVSFFMHAGQPSQLVLHIPAARVQLNGAVEEVLKRLPTEPEFRVPYIQLDDEAVS